jgi:hypothetical protein
LIRGNRRAAAILAPALAIGIAGACSVFVDHTADQCRTDADCAKFANHPTCQNGVCLSSGLGPPGCFYGMPQTSDQFLNACTTATCIPFDNCQHGLCDADAGVLTPPPTADAGTADAGAGTDAGSSSLPGCMDPVARPQVIYLTGSSNFPLLLAKLGPLIIRNTGYTPVYQVSSSCGGVRSIFSVQAKDHFIADPPTGSINPVATYVTPNGTLLPCSLGGTGTGGVRVDVGESDIFSTTCAGFGAPGGDVGEYLGPIQAMLFVVPSTSSQKAISAEMARAVFGRGGAQGLTQPWVTPTLYFVRNASTGTQQMIGGANGVPADQFWGVDRGSARNVAALLTVLSSGADHTSAEQAIGILSNDYYDADRGNLTALAFQAFNQSCGYLPDSTAFKTDKRNVRDGHYPIWGPLHFFANIAQGIPTSAAAQAFVSVVAEPEPGPDLLDAYIDAGLVPSCAMSVKRATDLGPLSAYVPPVMCGCHFEARLAGPDAAPPAGCAPCVTAAECTDPARPACRLGWCEAH